MSLATPRAAEPGERGWEIAPSSAAGARTCEVIAFAAARRLRRRSLWRNLAMTSQLELGGLGEPEDGDEPKVVVEKDLDVLAQGWTVYWTRSIKALFFESWFNLCMLAAPFAAYYYHCLLYTSPSPRDKRQSRMPSSA